MFDDEHVQVLDPEEVQSASAYVLFYTKVSLSFNAVMVMMMTMMMNKASPRFFFRT